MTVEVDGRTIAYRRAGRGTPMLLLHGGWSDSRDWRPQLEALAANFDVVAWDAPGCGGSSDPPHDFGMAGYADAVAGFVDVLALDRAHVVGLSFGGGLAIAVHDRHPRLARSLVLAGAYAGWAGSLPADEVAARLERMLSEIDRPAAEWAASYLPGFFAGQVPRFVVDEVLEVMLDTRPSGLRPMLEAFAAADLRHVLPRIDVPTLVLWGELDARSPLTIAEVIRDAVPRAELVVIPRVGHMTNLEAPEAFNAAVRRFCGSVRSEPAR